jgi:hypothetical protein
MTERKAKARRTADSSASLRNDKEEKAEADADSPCGFAPGRTSQTDGGVDLKQEG